MKYVVEWRPCYDNLFIFHILVAKLKIVQDLFEFC